jgi:hypothetical protein
MLALDLILIILQQATEPPGVKYNVAYIAAGAAIAGAVISGGITIANSIMSANKQKELETLKSDLTTETQAKIESLKADLAQQGKDRDARRDYEYEARKRLYDEVEPVRFNIYEALEEAFYRVGSLARTSRSGNLGIGDDSWIEEPGYYLLSTIYKLLLPVVHFRVLQRRMTFTDFNLDRDIALQYALLKLYVRSFTDDFDFAGIEPKLTYEPNADAERQARGNLAVFSRQGLVVGDLECIADLLIFDEDNKTRALQYGEFERLFNDPKELDDNLHEVLRLFVSFSPERKPVLARLLLVQAYFAQLILSTYQSAIEPSQLQVRLEKLLTDPHLLIILAWADGERADVDMVRAYLGSRIKRLGSTTRY